MTLQTTMRRCRGFALMLAVFMIVTLAAIGLYLVTISTGQIQAVSQDEQSVRAYQAARTGIDLAAFQLLRNPPCTPSQRLTLTQGLSGFYSEVTCLQTPIAGETEGATTVNVYKITATGCNANPCTPSPATPADQTYVERQLQLTLTVTQ